MRILFRNLGNIRYVFRMLRDESVPKWNKAVLIFAVVYFFSPLDFIPEAVFPGLGHLDDLMVLLAVFNSFSDVWSSYRTKNPTEKSPGNIIGDENVKYTVEEDESNE